MTDQQKPDLSKVEPVTTWSDEEQPQGGPAATRTDPGTSVDPVLGSGSAVPLVDQPTNSEPRTSPETEQELDRLRRG